MNHVVSSGPDLTARDAPGKAEVRLAGQTLGAALSAAARHSPDCAVTFPGKNVTLTTVELLSLAERCAQTLIADGVRSGEVVGLLADCGPGLLAGVFGCALAGAAVTILPPPGTFRREGLYHERLRRIVNAAEMRRLMIDPFAEDAVRSLAGLGDGLSIVPALGGQRSAGPLPDVSAEDLAVVQFTSGTTMTPRGVMLSHRTVLAGLRAIVLSAEFSPRDVFVQWMPHHHDMGLFGHLSQVLNGIPSHVFEPLAFLRRPAEILRYMSERRATVLTGVNFSYEILMKAATPEVLRGLDLSAWRLAFNGAEPVAVDTVRRFAEVFGAAGVRPSVMYPVYGMAEATLAIAFPAPGSMPRTVTVDRDRLAREGLVDQVRSDHPAARDVVSVGGPVAGLDLRVVDGDGCTLGDGRLGEFQIRGEMVTSGYLSDPAGTVELFDGEWLRTGDIGFRMGEDCFVLGRRKEMIIVRGENFFPEDAESVARDVPGVHRRHAVAVAEVVDGRESIAVIAETRLSGPDTDDLAERIRQRVVQELGTSAVRVHLVAPGWLTRTTSGKWQRKAAAERIGKEDT